MSLMVLRAGARLVRPAAAGAGFRIFGGAVIGRLGQGSALRGDLNEDGKAEVLATAPGESAAGRVNAGSAYGDANEGAAQDGDPETFAIFGWTPVRRPPQRGARQCGAPVLLDPPTVSGDPQVGPGDSEQGRLTAGEGALD